MALIPGESIRFDYTGKVQSITLGPGRYRIQCYGAKGANGSNGGYIQGDIGLTKDTVLYAYCGQSPTNYTGGWNGGSNCSNTSGLGGGGRSDVALDGAANSTTWNSDAHLQNILISAKGGNGGTITGATPTTLKSGTASYTNRAGVLVYTWSPTVSIECTFYTISHTSDPYGHVFKNGSSYLSNDDGNGNLDFKISFTATPGNTYQFYVGAYSAAGSASYVITTGTQTIVGGNGAGSNYYYAANTVSSYPYGTCKLNSSIYVEDALSYSTHTDANSHGYIVITRIAAKITYINCTGSRSQVYGKDADYASAICVVSTLLCIITMPIMVMLYQL